MSKIIKAPQPFFNEEGFKIFLAGSIEMGTAENWQQQVEDALKDSDAIILNPRRDDWDSSWEQNIRNPKFYEQVEWELNGLDAADFIVMYFDPATKSPITLLELGLYINKKYKLVVCCPDGYWRKGNVDIVCQRYNIQQMMDLDALLKMLKSISPLLKTI
jgi:hypothetical protein